MFLEHDGDTEVARAVDVMMVQAKRIYILIINVNKLFSFSLWRYFLKEIENMFSMFYRIIETLVKVWENSKKLCKHSPAARVPSISRSPKLPLVFLFNN